MRKIIWKFSSRHLFLITHRHSIIVNYGPGSKINWIFFSGKSLEINLSVWRFQRFSNLFNSLQFFIFSLPQKLKSKTWNLTMTIDFSSTIPFFYSDLIFLFLNSQEKAPNHFPGNAENSTKFFENIFVNLEISILEKGLVTCALQM